MLRRLLVWLYFRILRGLSVPRDFAYCVLCGVKYRPDWQFFGLPMLRCRRGASIVIGRGFKACSKAKWNSIGVFQPVIIRACAPGSAIRIGDHVGVSGCTISAQNSITIGSHVLVGSGALITDSDAHALDPAARRAGKGGVSKPIVIEDDVFIGARAIVLKGVVLGKGCVVGAGAVVTRNVPAYEIVAGNPARSVGRVR